MEKSDLLKPVDEVTVVIWGPDGSKLYETTNKGFHTLEEAVNAAVSNAGLQIDPKDCVFEVTNHNREVTHKYRLNAHDNLKLII